MGISSPNTADLWPMTAVLQRPILVVDIYVEDLHTICVLPPYVTLVFMYRMSRHSGAMSVLRADFPWEMFSIMLNTLLASAETTGAIENDTFPFSGKIKMTPVLCQKTLLSVVYCGQRIAFLPEVQ